MDKERITVDEVRKKEEDKEERKKTGKRERGGKTRKMINRH